MELLENTKDYIFAFCVYALFSGWSIYVALQTHGPMHRPSLLMGIFGGALILYFFFMASIFTKRTSSQLEKWIGGLTVGICVLEAAKLLLRFSPRPIETPLAMWFEVFVYGAAFLLAAARMMQVLRFGVHSGNGM